MATRDRRAPDPAQQPPTRGLAGPERREPGEEQWRGEFPYRWREDDLVTRRDTLRFLVAGAGALFVATAALDAVGHIADVTSARPDHIVAVAGINELQVNQAKVFTFPDQFGQGIIINLPGKGLVAYSDVCTHLSCAVLYQGDGKHLYCPCHEGLFDAATGDVLAGPPTRPLPIIELSVHGDTIYAVREVAR
ncbi:MAG TPA: ubiquinol-cytochrome c reductase iron-sulfur subunit [Ktedonobacterales bacterium]